MTEATQQQPAPVARAARSTMPAILILLCLLGAGGVYFHEREKAAEPTHPATTPAATTSPAASPQATTSQVKAPLPAASPARQQAQVQPAQAQQTQAQAIQPQQTLSLQAQAPTSAPANVTVSATSAPSVDVVRVDKDGALVMAGRADAGATVTLRNGDTVLAQTTADPDGQWVILPDAPLPPGVHQLSLSSEMVTTLPRQAATTPASQAAAAAAAGQIATQNAEPQASAATQGPTSSGPAAPRLATQTPIIPKTAAQNSAIQNPTVQNPDTRTTVLINIPAAGGGAPTVSGGGAGKVALNAGPMVVVSQGTAAPRLLLAPPGSHPGVVGLDIVQYDDKGRISFTGHAHPGRTVRLYVDNHAVGDAVAGGDGLWSLSPAHDLAPGLHKLRTDELAPSGKVAARSEVPFARADLADGLPPGHAIVQPGDCLWTIARQSYGHGVQYTAIYQANLDQIRDPDLIYPGQAFRMPTADEAAHAPPPPPRHQGGKTSKGKNW